MAGWLRYLAGDGIHKLSGHRAMLWSYGGQDWGCYSLLESHWDGVRYVVLGGMWAWGGMGDEKTTPTTTTTTTAAAAATKRWICGQWICPTVDWTDLQFMIDQSCVG